MDWLLERQPHIERKLAKRHLCDGSTVFYDVSSSSYHGTHCPLAVRGHNRDGLKLPGIAYGLLTDRDGRPVAVRVYAGNTADPATVPDQIEALRGDFGVGRFVIVGDRGMLTNTQIETLREHSDFAGERLVACFNPLLAMDRNHTREELLDCTEALLRKLAIHVQSRKEKPFTAAEIGVKALSAPDAVRAYKRLGNVEKAFRTFKGVDLRVRPIHHHLEDRVRAHIFLCMLAYYVEWHMRMALAPLLYADEELDVNRAARDPVAKALLSPAVRHKHTAKESSDGMPLRRWDGLIGSLSTLVRNTCRVGESKTAVRFERDTEPNAYQNRVFELIAQDATWWPNKCAQ